MLYVVDQSNPKEPMEYIRVTREEIFKIKRNIDPQRFNNISLSNDKISLCHYALKDIEIPYYYDTKPVKVGTIYTYLLNIQDLRKLEDYIIDPFNDIDFILYYDSYPLYNLNTGKINRSILNFYNDKNYAILNDYVTNPQISKSSSRINSLNNYLFYSFYSDFTNVESTPTYIFKKFMIHALKNLIDIVSSSQYNNFFKTKETDDLFQRDCDEILNITNDYPYFVVKNYFINVIQECISSTESKYYDTLLRYLKKLCFKYEASLYNVNNLDNMNLEESIQLFFEIYYILYLYQSMHIEVSNYYDLFSDSSDFSFEKYENTITYEINVQDFNTTWFWNNNFKCLLDDLHDIFINEDNLRTNIQHNIYNTLKKICIVYDNFPLEYVFLLRFFSSFAITIETNSTSKNLAYIDLIPIKTSKKIKFTVENFNSQLLSDTLNFKNFGLKEDIDIFFSQSVQNQIFKAPRTLYYNFNKSEYEIKDLFKPAIESYLLFSKHPIDQCSHCHMFFLKTSPNRKFCDSALTLKSGMTCKEEREAATEHKSLYQKTTNDFKQYLQKVTLKGGPSYTRRVYNILEKNKYFDSEKPKSFEKLSKSDTKDLLWMLNSFFNYSYAIMESMNFQEIVKDPTFKDIRYYNNSPENNFTPDAYTDLFEEYKKYTRTNKVSNKTEIVNIYDSLVKFSEKDSELSFKTIRSKSMQDLNRDDITNLFEITKTVIRVFFLKLSEWYLEDPNQDYPSFFYAFPKEFATSELSNIEYINKNANDNDNIENIDNLKEKIKKKRNDPYIAEDIKAKVQINGARERQVINLITELREKISDNHPVK
ncbi:hypothetical protein [uncultured Holdemanella sp.]|uniref:hypothetical protein n=1 Tax=uncultured Holdemanella sp. TaxID=1763549 RepID=UPI0025DC7F0A|nr:hypothetical protein [uncultured Holdemanella sp.]